MGAARRLPKQLHDAIGPAAGADLMMILDEIRADHARQMQATKAWIDERFGAIDARFDKVDGRFERVDERLGALGVKLGDVKADLMKWSFVFWVGAVTAIAILAGVLGR